MIMQGSAYITHFFDHLKNMCSKIGRLGGVLWEIEGEPI